MNDYLCAVLLNIETYNHPDKYKSITGEGHTLKNLKVRIRVVPVRAFRICISFAILLAEIESNHQSLLQLIRKEVSNLFTDIKTNLLLNRWKRVFWNLLPAISQNLHTKLTLHRKMVRQISFLYLLGVRGWNLFFDLHAPKSSLPEITF